MTNDAGIRPSPGRLIAPAVDSFPTRQDSKAESWSLSLQREITRDLVIDVAYVGNRGDGFTPIFVSINAISEERLRSFGLDINMPTIRRCSARASIATGGFAWLQ